MLSILSLHSISLDVFFFFPGKLQLNVWPLYWSKFYYWQNTAPYRHWQLPGGCGQTQQPPTDAITVAALFVSTLHSRSSFFFFFSLRPFIFVFSSYRFLTAVSFCRPGLVFIWLHDIYFLVYCCTSVWNLCATTAFSARANRHYQSLKNYICIHIYIYVPCPQRPNLSSDRHEQLFWNRCFNGRRTYFAGIMQVALCSLFFFFFHFKCAACLFFCHHSRVGGAP